MNDIIKAGVKTKVLMLSATPVNNNMNVKNFNDETLELIVVKAPAPTK